MNHEYHTGLYMADHEYLPSATEPCCRVCGRSPLEHPFPVEDQQKGKS